MSEADAAAIAAMINGLQEQVTKLQAFKDWVHAYLDSRGVPHHPPGAHGAEGCRIGDRMDYVWNRLIGDKRSRENLLRQQAAMQWEVFELRDRVHKVEDALRPFAAIAVQPDTPDDRAWLATWCDLDTLPIVGAVRCAAALLIPVDRTT